MDQAPRIFVSLHPWPGAQRPAAELQAARVHARRRALARHVRAAHGDAPAGQVRLYKAPGGAPRLAAPLAHVAISVAHAGGWLALASQAAYPGQRNMNLGIDLEPSHRFAQSPAASHGPGRPAGAEQAARPLALASRYLPPAVQAMLAALPLALQAQAVLRAFVLWEAASKATGHGLRRTPWPMVACDLLAPLLRGLHPERWRRVQSGNHVVGFFRAPKQPALCLALAAWAPARVVLLGPALALMRGPFAQWPP